MRISWHACALALLAGAFAAAQSAQDGAALLHQVADTYKNLKSYHFESVTETQVISEREHNATTSRMTLAASGPDRLRVYSESPVDWTLVVSDGKILWRARPYTREFMRTALTGPPLEPKGGGGIEGDAMLRRSRFFLERNGQVDQNLKAAEVLREETIEVADTPVACTVVVADYAPRGSGVRSWTRTFWIDKARHIILREEAVDSGKLFPDRPFVEAENRSRVRYTVASINEPIPDALFTYVPPANFRELDKLEHRSTLPDTTLIGKPAPELTLNTLDGKPVALSSLRGKTVLLDFWASWCIPCRNQLPTVAKLYGEIKDQGLVLLGMDDDESPAIAQKFDQENQYDWPSLFDGMGHAGRKAFHVDAIPTLVLIDKSGMIVDIQVGAGPTTEPAVRAALAKQGFHISQ
jgi:thiol-disulfide isomerase/thioredoxin/outer membrane lipoprotein-sorting protein